MPEIGATLREARMRQRIDIAEVELETKIRAKYLRALENEEWDLLPGTTYVKSFLRTYAEALGLDGRLLVEEYKLRHERLSDVELQPISPRSGTTGQGRRRRRSGSPRLPRGLVVAAVVGALLVALYFLGSGNDNPSPETSVDTTPAETTRGAREARGQNGRTGPAAGAGRHTGRRRSRTVRLQIIPLGPVFVCLTARGQGRLVNGQIVHPGELRRTFHSRRFRLTLGNDRVRLRINGKLRSVPAVTRGIGYEITRAGRRTLPPGKRPTCV
jgi:hypothetical protein